MKWDCSCLLALTLQVINIESKNYVLVQVGTEEYYRWLFFRFQSRQPVFVRLLRGAFRLSQCSWMTGSQKYHVETCIKTLSDVGESRIFPLKFLAWKSYNLRLQCRNTDCHTWHFFFITSHSTPVRCCCHAPELTNKCTLPQFPVFKTETRDLTRKTRMRWSLFNWSASVSTYFEEGCIVNGWRVRVFKENLN